LRRLSCYTRLCALSCSTARRPPPPTLFPYTRSSDLGEPHQPPDRPGQPRGAKLHRLFAVVDFVDLHLFDDGAAARIVLRKALQVDRKSTRLNSSHVKISYAVFCLKKKIYLTCSRLSV